MRHFSHHTLMFSITCLCWFLVEWIGTYEAAHLEPSTADFYSMLFAKVVNSRRAESMWSVSMAASSSMPSRILNRCLVDIYWVNNMVSELICTYFFHLTDAFHVSQRTVLFLSTPYFWSQAQATHGIEDTSKFIPLANGSGLLVDVPDRHDWSCQIGDQWKLFSGTVPAQWFAGTRWTCPPSLDTHRFQQSRTPS